MRRGGDVSEPLALVVPAELVEAIARRVAELLGRDQPRQESVSPWLDVDGACAYLGFGRNTLYKLSAAGAIPCRKKAGGQGLRFHREELDTWMEEQYPRVDRLG
jgi:excisionase family DNA binding protein